MEIDEFNVQRCLKECRDLFPAAAFISVKDHAVSRLSSMFAENPQADIQIDDRGCRRTTLAECMEIVRAWAKEQS